MAPDSARTMGSEVCGVEIEITGDLPSGLNVIEKRASACAGDVLDG